MYSRALSRIRKKREHPSLDDPDIVVQWKSEFGSERDPKAEAYQLLSEISLRTRQLRRLNIGPIWIYQMEFLKSFDFILN